MFIGHFAVGFAAKRAVPKVSLGVLIAAASLLDFLWGAFLLLGWERVRIQPGNTAFTPLAFDAYPISHSLLAAAGWAALCGLLYRRSWRGAGIIAGVVLSHWALDALSHRPDLLLMPAGTIRVGLGLWNSAPATVVVEGGLFVAGVWMYARFTRATDRIGRWAFVMFVALLALLYAGNIFGPPPPSWQAVAWSDLAALLFVAWAAWFDRHRDVGGEGRTQ